MRHGSREVYHLSSYSVPWAGEIFYRGLGKIRHKVSGAENAFIMRKEEKKMVTK